MTNACPISNDSVDERAARLCALLVLIPLGLSLYFASPWPALFLGVDFGFRGLGARRLSPLACLAQWPIRRLGLAPRRTNAGPKAFAAKLGLGFSLAVALAFAFHQAAFGTAAAVPFALCAILEGACGLCVGCRLYQLWQHVRPAAEPPPAQS